MLFCGIVIASTTLFLMTPHISYRTMRQSEMGTNHPAESKEMLVISNRHPFPDSPSIVGESHELKCVSISNRTKGFCLLYDGYGIGESLHKIGKNDRLIFGFDKEWTLVRVADKDGTVLAIAPDALLKSLMTQPPGQDLNPEQEIKFNGTIQKL